MAAAARKLGIHESKLSRHVKTLEQETGLRLVVRRPAIGADPLTDEGRQLLKFANAYAFARQQARATATALSTRRSHTAGSHLDD